MIFRFFPSLPELMEHINFHVRVFYFNFTFFLYIWNKTHLTFHWYIFLWIIIHYLTLPVVFLLRFQCFSKSKILLFDPPVYIDALCIEYLKIFWPFPLLSEPLLSYLWVQKSTWKHVRRMYYWLVCRLLPRCWNTFYLFYV